jgi:hypothetical protein
MDADFDVGFTVLRTSSPRIRFGRLNPRSASSRTWPVEAVVPSFGAPHA